MASRQPAAAETDEFAATEVAPRRVRKPFYRDPLSILGWGIALASVIAYWYFFVRKPIPKPGEEVARITAVEGRVRVKPNARETWEPATLADRLHVGDVVQTEPRSGAEISFDAGSAVRVRPSSIVYLGGSAESSTAAWRVESGRVNFSVGDQATEIVTPTVRATAQENATGNIDVGEEGDTGVKIFTGQAEVETSLGQRITLAENEAVQVDAAGKAGDKQVLPAPPDLVAPASKAELPFVLPPDPTARLQWKAVAGGRTYRVALDYNVVQANLLLSAALDETGIRQTSHELQGLDPGRYFWRVAAVNEAGLEGGYSRVAFFSVVTPAEPPPLEITPEEPGPPPLTLGAIEEVAAGVYHVRGRAAPGSTVTVDGYPVKIRPDGSFSEYVRRGDQGELVVQATGPDGQLSEQTRPIPQRR